MSGKSQKTRKEQDRTLEVPEEKATVTMLDYARVTRGDLQRR